MPMKPALTLPSWRWPWPAAGAWAAAWWLGQALQPGLGAGGAWAVGSLVVLAVAWVQGTRWRQITVLLGHVAVSSLQAQALPSWAWASALVLLVLAYPLGAWRDAPWFPTPARALDGLSGRLLLPPDVAVLDAGCGTGQGLLALRGQWPQARLHGIERSRLWAAWTRRRLPGSVIVHGDMWSASWSPFTLVYLFQRPESMDRAWAKACEDMAPGSWLVSLEFPVPGLEPTLSLKTVSHRPVWVYRVAPQDRGQSVDKSHINQDGQAPCL